MEITQTAEKLAARETLLQEADQALDSSRAEVEALRRGLDRARAREREAVGAVEEERQAALGKIAELENVIERSEREHAVVRERMEGRLELLRSAMEEEEQENASQVCGCVGFCPRELLAPGPPCCDSSGAATRMHMRLARPAPPPGNLTHSEQRFGVVKIHGMIPLLHDTLAKRTKAALAELLEQKTRADDLAAELNQKLRHADEALRAAEARATRLKDAQDEAEAKAAAAASAPALEEAACLAAAEGAVDTVVAAAIAAAEGLQRARDTAKVAVVVSDAAWVAENETVVSAESERNRAEKRPSATEAASAAAARVLPARVSLAEAEPSRQPAGCSKETPATSTGEASFRQGEEEGAAAEVARATHEEEVELWRGEAGRARAGETAAREEATAARTKLLGLEEAMEESQRSHDSFRERTERRLESLRRAVEDEELEQGPQVSWSSFRVLCSFR